MSADNASRNPREVSLAKRTREIAQLVAQLYDDIQALFVAGQSRENRVGRAGLLTGTILVDSAPTVGWVERRCHPDTAVLLQQRLDHVCTSAVNCAASEIPEWQPGGSPTEPCSAGLNHALVFMVTARLLAANIEEWAGDIESEEASRTENRPTKPGKKRRRQRPRKPDFTLRESQALDLWSRGTSVLDIGKSLDVGTGRVYQLLKSANQRNPELYSAAKRQRQEHEREGYITQAARAQRNLTPSKKYDRLQSDKKQDEQRDTR